MTDDRDFEQRLATWLQSAAPAPAPDLAERLLRTTARSPQRGGWTGWSRMVPVIGAAAVLAVAVVVGLQLGRVVPGPDPIGGEPSSSAVAPPGTTSPTPVSALPSASATASPSTGPFSDANRCENGIEGYAVEYPSDWYANEEIPASDGLDRVPACRYFAGTEFEVRPNAGLPPTVAISFQRAPEETPVDGSELSSEQTTVGGHQATVRESQTAEGGFMPAGTLIYEYLITLDAGDVLIVGTDSSRDGDYAEHRHVLDQMMQTLEIGP